MFLHRASQARISSTTQHLSRFKVYSDHSPLYTRCKSRQTPGSCLWRAYVSCAVSRGDDARARQTQVGDDRNLRPFRDSLDLARLPFFIKVLNKKPGDSAAAAFSNESAANYTLGRAETRVDKGALVAGHALPRRRPRWRAPPGRGGRTRTDGGESSADGRTDGAADMRII